MRATGIVRRIDDLGRIVIPIEIRRNMNIRDGDPLEIFVDKNGEVILKKYSAIADLADFVQGLADSLHETTHLLALVTDRDEVVAEAGAEGRGHRGRRIGEVVIRAMDGRETLVFAPDRHNHPGSVFDGEERCPFASEVIAPVIQAGDPVGAVILASTDPRQPVTQIEVKLAQTAAGFVARHMEE